MVGTASLVVVGLADPIMTELQVSPPFIGYLVSIFAISFAITAPIAISVFGDFPMVHLLLTGLVLMACSLVPNFYSPDLEGLQIIFLNSKF